MPARTKVAPAREPGQALHDAAGKRHDNSTTPVSQAEAFLRDLYGDRAPGFIAISAVKAIKPGARKPPFVTWWHRAADHSGAAAKAVASAAHSDVYVGLGLHREAGDAHHRGGADDVLAIPGVWLEIDFAGGTHPKPGKGKVYFATREDALAFVASLPLPPTLIVSSGGGLHLYWLLREPWVFDDDAERLDAAATVAGWQRFVIAEAKRQSYDIDATHDLARVFRVAGTLNHKAKPPLRVEIIQRNDTRYNPNDFAEWVVPAVDASKAQPSLAGALVVQWETAAAPPAKLAALLANDPRFRLTWDNKRTDLADQSPSALCLALANILVGAGLSDQEVCDALVQWRREHHASQKYSGWYARTIAKAHERARSEGTAARQYLLTDGGNAERFADEHRGQAHYIHAWGEWLIFDGQRWVPADRGQVQQLAKETTRRMLREAAAEPDDDKRKLRVRWAMKSDSRSGREAMLFLARSEPGIPLIPEEFDLDPWVLNCEDGTVDLRTGALRPHRREDRITKLAPVAYNSTATAPRWERFLAEVLLDPALRLYVQAVIGYACTGDVSEQCLFFLYGSGANGKSVFLAAIQAVLGDYAIQVMPDLLMAGRGEHHSTELTDLYRRRFVATIEAEEGRRFNESLVKWLTGGDKIRARRMNENFWEFDPTHKIFLAANSKPVIRGDEHAIWRRIWLIPFVVTIPEERRDPHLIDALKAEAPAILRWAVEGCLTWQREGLKAPAVVKGVTTDYQAEMDLIGRFIAERCVVGPFAEVQATDLYKNFRAWCSENREREFTQGTFGRRLKARGFTPGKPRRSGHWWLGLGLLAHHVGEPGDPCDPFEAIPGPLATENSHEGGPRKRCEWVTRVTPERSDSVQSVEREPGEDDDQEARP